MRDTAVDGYIFKRSSTPPPIGQARDQALLADEKFHKEIIIFFFKSFLSISSTTFLVSIFSVRALTAHKKWGVWKAFKLKKKKKKKEKNS